MKAPDMDTKMFLRTEFRTFLMDQMPLYHDKEWNSKIPQPVLEIMFDSLGRLRS